jgi:hypothetical protein
MCLPLRPQGKALGSSVWEIIRYHSARIYSIVITVISTEKSVGDKH